MKKIQIDRTFLTDELIEEFSNLNEDLDLEHYPIQAFYQYQLFLLNKGLYGTAKIESEEIGPTGEVAKVPE